VGLRLNIKSYWPERWEWEKTGLVQIFAMPDVRSSAVVNVADEIRGLAKELQLPLTVQRTRQPRDARELLRIITRIRRGKRLDVGELKDQVNEFRRTEDQLRPGLVILVNPRSVDPLGQPDDAERGIYGESYADGVCTLREYHPEAVRHEFAHMLGMGEHCRNQMCLMQWSCPSENFCSECLNTIRTVCVVERT
jgi:hypothetical protein